jgi:class 3 adenylate cyclase
MVAVPSGTVTFLFTDVEGSTAHWEQRPDVMRTALEMHDAILQAVMGERGGAVFATGGDGFAVAFGRAEAAVSAAIGAQRRLAAQMWPDGLALKVRMGLHTGEAHERDGDYFGPAVNRAARVMDAANRSQILLSAATREVVRDGSRNRLSSSTSAFTSFATWLTRCACTGWRTPRSTVTAGRPVPAVFVPGTSRPRLGRCSAEPTTSTR